MKKSILSLAVLLTIISPTCTFAQKTKTIEPKTTVNSDTEKKAKRACKCCKTQPKKQKNIDKKMKTLERAIINNELGADITETNNMITLKELAAKIAALEKENKQIKQELTATKRQVEQNGQLLVRELGKTIVGG